jgi:hypothetical protein
MTKHLSFGIHQAVRVKRNPHRAHREYNSSRIQRPISWATLARYLMDIWGEFPKQRPAIRWRYTSNNMSVVK